MIYITYIVLFDTIQSSMRCGMIIISGMTEYRQVYRQYSKEGLYVRVLCISYVIILRVGSGTYYIYLNYYNIMETINYKLNVRMHSISRKK